MPLYQHPCAHSSGLTARGRADPASLRNGRYEARPPSIGAAGRSVPPLGASTRSGMELSVDVLVAFGPAPRWIAGIGRAMPPAVSSSACFADSFAAFFAAFHALMSSIVT